MNDNKLNNQNSIVCAYCGYIANPATATHCLRCGKSLAISSQNSNKAKRFTPWMIWLSFGLLFVLVSWFIYSLFGNSSLDNSKDIELFNSSSSNQKNSLEVKLYNSINEVTNVPEGTFNYGGATLFSSLIAHGINEAITKAHPNFRLRYTEPRDNKPGGRKGIAMLLNGELSFAQIAAPVDDKDYIKAEQRGFKLNQVPVALDMLVLFTHPEVSIPGLSVNQIEDIYTGKLTNWKQVGGGDLPIVPFTIDPKAANLLNDLLGKEAEQISPKVQFVRDYTDAIRKVASTPGGISFGGNAPLIGQQTIRPLPIAKANSHNYVQPFINKNQQSNAAAIRNGTYPITRRLFIVFRQDGTIDQLAGQAYTNMLLSQEGQQIVEKAGLVPLR